MKEFEEIIHDSQETEILNAISTLTCQPSDLDKVLGEVLDLILKLFKTDTGTVALLNGTSNELELKVHRGVSREFVQSITMTNLDEGAARLAISKRSPVFVNARDYPDIQLKRFVEMEGLRWIACSPIQRKDEIMGVINIAGRTEREFPSHDLHLLGLIASRVSVIIENQRLLRETRERSAQMASILKTGALLISSLDIEQTMNKIVEEAANLVGTDACSIFFYDPERKMMNGQVAYGIPDEMIKMVSIPLDLFPAAESALRKNRVISLNCGSQDAVIPREIFDIFGFRTSLIVPLSFMGNPLGMLFLGEAKYNKHFTPSEIELATNFANYVSIAIQNARLYKESTDRREQAEAVQLIGQALTSRLDYQDVLRSIAQYARQMCHAKFTVVSTKDEYYFKPVAIAGEDEGYASVIRFTDDPNSSSGLGPGGRAARSKIPAVVSDCENDPTFAPWKEEALKRGIRASVSIPLVSKDTTFGVLSAYSGEINFFDKKKVTLLASFANFAAIAMENARLYHELKHAFENLKETQSRLVQTEKLSAIGEMVAGVAHEINNPLTAVMGFSQLLLGEKCEERIKAKLIKINDEATRCAKIVHNLLAFARKHKPEKRYIGINGVIESVLDLRSYQLKVDNIIIKKKLDPDLPKTMADYTQLQQVFLNIINNAQQAMAEKNGGTISVTTESNGRSIQITFADTGSGISRENLRKIFDPFFTTKPAGKGTGLGLSLCYGIVREHGGNIRVESEEGHGAVFSIELPVIEDLRKKEEQKAEETEPKAEKKQSLNILVVDDEEMIIDLLTEFLGDKGCVISSATSGEEGIEKIMKESYDLIFCDMKMKGMGGEELYRKIKKEKPEAAPRIVFSTGDTMTQNVRDFFKETGCIFISKPFNFQNLLGIIESFR